MTKFVLRLTWTIVYSTLISGAAILFADCPDGVRATTESEQQIYSVKMQALKAAIPNAPEGWELQPVKFLGFASTSVCKGSELVAAVDSTYVSLAERKQNDERDRQYEARIDALRKLSPSESSRPKEHPAKIEKCHQLQNPSSSPEPYR